MIFTEKIKTKADEVVARYETRRASILEILHLMQEEYGYISLEIEKEVADYLGLPAVDVREVVTFYTLYYTKPKAETRLNICQSLSCSLMGAEDLFRHLEDKLGVKTGEMTPDKKFCVQRVECLGACEIAPMMQLNDKGYIGHLKNETVDGVIERARQNASSGK